MDETEQSEYLAFKNTPMTPKTKPRQIKKQNSQNIYTSVKQNQKKDKKDSRSNSKNKYTLISDSNIKRTANKSKSNSKCQVISFSTSATKNIKQKQNQKNQINRNQELLAKLQSQNLTKREQNRLNKAKSQLNLNYEQNRVQIQKLRPQKFMEGLYGMNMKEYKQTDNNDSHQRLQLLKLVKSYQNKIKRLQKQIELKNLRIKQLQKSDSLKIKDECQVQSYLRPQNRYSKQQNRENVRRLLKMLQLTQQYKQFSTFALQDNGITLLQSTTKTQKTKIDLLSDKNKLSKFQKKFHYCSCNKEFIPQPYLWVPQSIYEYGKDFVKFDQNHKQCFLTKSEYQLLLYQLNKMWRQRQKRIINTLKQEKNSEIQKLKRKYVLYKDKPDQNRSAATTRKNFY